MINRWTAVDQLAQLVHATFGVEPLRELRFHPVRRWRFDIALQRWKVGVEVDGGTFVQGRHSRGAGYREDMRKLGEALELGWIVVRCTPELVYSGEAIRWIQAAVRYVEPTWRL